MDEVPGVYDAAQRESHLREFAETVRRSRQEDDPGYILDDAMGEMQGILMGSPDDPRRDKATLAIRELEWLYDRLATAGPEVTQMVAAAYWAGRLAEQAIVMEIDPLVRASRKSRNGGENGNTTRTADAAERYAKIRERFDGLIHTGMKRTQAIQETAKLERCSEPTVRKAIKERPS